MEKIDFEKLLLKSWELKNTKECLEATLKEVTTELEENSKLLLNAMKESNIVEFSYSEQGLFINKFEKKSVSYKDEKEVIKFLKEKYNGNYIRTKTTIEESLDKNPLKTAIKTDSVLNNFLKDMIQEKITEYVVITNEENHNKMLEHISKESK